MTWAKSDDHEPLHPKVFRAGLIAYGFFQAAKCYCSRNLTDGLLPVCDLGLVFPGVTHPQAVKLAVKLAECQLFEVVDEHHYRVHDYLDYNPSREQVMAEREAVKRRIGDWRSRKRNAVGNAVTPTVTNAVSNAVGNGSPVPVPVPVPKKLKAEQAAQPRDAASPGDEWELRSELRAALEDTRFLGLAADRRWWLAEFRIHAENDMVFEDEITKAEGWCVSNPHRAPKRDYRRFLHSWFSRAANGGG